MVQKLIELAEELLEAIKASAKKNHRSANGEIIHAIEYYLKNAPDARPDSAPTKENKPTKKIP